MVVRTSFNPLGFGYSDGIPIIQLPYVANNYIIKGIIDKESINDVNNYFCITNMINYYYPQKNSQHALIGNWGGGSSYTDNTPNSVVKNCNIGNVTIQHESNKYFIYAHIPWIKNTCMYPINSNYVKSDYVGFSSMLLDTFEGKAYNVLINNNETFARNLRLIYGNIHTIDVAPSTINFTSSVSQSVEFPLTMIAEAGTTTGGYNSTCLNGIYRHNARSSSYYNVKISKFNNSSSIAAEEANTGVSVTSTPNGEVHWFCTKLNSTDYTNMWSVKMALNGTNKISVNTVASQAGGLPASFGGYIASLYDYDNGNSTFQWYPVGGSIYAFTDAFHYEGSLITFKTLFLTRNVGTNKWKLCYLSSKPTTSNGAICKAFKFTGWPNRLTFNKKPWTVKISGNYLVVQFIDSSIALINGSTNKVRYFRPESLYSSKMTNKDYIVSSSSKSATSKYFMVLIGVSANYMLFIQCTGNSAAWGNNFPKIDCRYDDAAQSDANKYYVIRSALAFSEVENLIEPNPDLIMVPA